MMRNFINPPKLGEEKSRPYEERFQHDRCYQVIRWIAEWMDRRYLDPIIGVFIPILGDLSVLVLNLPFLYFSLFRVKSIPLSFAILYNALLDCLIGLIPFGIGDLLDIFYRSYVRNCRLIVGYVEEDQKVVFELRKRMSFFVVAIAILLVGMVLLIKYGLMILQSLFDYITALC